MILKLSDLFRLAILIQFISSSGLTVQIMHPETWQKFTQTISSDNLIHHYLSTSSEMSFKSVFFDNSPDICKHDYNTEITLENPEEKFVLFVQDNGNCNYKDKLQNAHPKVRVMFFIVPSVEDARKKYQDEIDKEDQDDKNQKLEPFNSFGVFIEENDNLVRTIKTQISKGANAKISQPFDTIVTVEQGAVAPKSDILLNLVSRPFTNSSEMNRITISHLRAVMLVQAQYQLRKNTGFDFLISGMSLLKYTTVNSGEVNRLSKEEFKASKEDIKNNLVSACFRKVASDSVGLINGVTTKPDDGYDNEEDEAVRKNLKEWKIKKDRYGALMYRYLFYLNGIYNKYIQPGTSSEVVFDDELFKTVKLGYLTPNVKSCVETYKAKLEKVDDWSKDDEFLSLYFVVEINDFSNKDFEIFTPFYLIEKKMAEVGPHCGPSSCPLKDLICFNLAGVDLCNKRGVDSNIDFEGKGDKFGCSGNQVPDNSGVCGGDEWGHKNSTNNKGSLFKKAFVIILVVILLLLTAVIVIKSNDRVGKTIDNMYKGIFSRRRSTFTQLIDKKSRY